MACTPLERIRAATLRHSVDAQRELAEALIETGNNWTRAAATLGVNFRQFRYLMKKHGVAVEAYLAKANRAAKDSLYD